MVWVVNHRAKGGAGMPLVSIIYQERAVGPEVLLRLYELRQTIAEQLSTSESELTEDQIQLNYERAHPFNIGRELQVIVKANRHPERLGTIDERTQQISAQLKKLIGPKIHGFVYIRLTEGGLESF